ncbi:hypothetical protein [Enterococcus gilvus]|uniref:Uncharacterized protein n=1 Tax=Enterococcus gilvus ATCC BAA-350 TaxID=1158614 RepID=R2VMK6_9ENTE|nr:hypothetical protein [Enterococcus gilvus]EOI58876.1 hypothetical protein UKC_00062 [Enterococcus gilvus ATCC BAA-350]EOW79247.1 hypothetical protein I592_03385 [Enterococcus gilvus ATCC BAA-350]OJG43684.1 hypothetical protein RV02_GL002068 [Enterococcus gilvus]
MFNRDVAISDPDNRVFTNINPRSTEAAEVDYDYNLDDFGSQVLPDDLVMKVVFKKRKISKDCLTTITFAKYVTIDNYVELIDDVGIEYQDYSFAIEGREYLQKKLEGALDRE